MNNYNKISGFTLIELVVVISIVSVLLLFSFPVFRDISLFSDSTTRVGDIVRLANDLKKRAVKKNIDFVMHLDTGSGLLWVTNDAMDDKAKDLAKEKGVLFSDNIQVLDIEFPGIKDSGNREHRIRFQRKGYSDFVLIHIIEDEKDMTLRIEPFLPLVKVLHKHVYFTDCI